MLAPGKRRPSLSEPQLLPLTEVVSRPGQRGQPGPVASHEAPHSSFVSLLCSFLWAAPPFPSMLPGQQGQGREGASVPSSGPFLRAPQPTLWPLLGSACPAPAFQCCCTPHFPFWAHPALSGCSAFGPQPQLPEFGQGSFSVAFRLTPRALTRASPAGPTLPDSCTPGFSFSNCESPIQG